MNPTRHSLLLATGTLILALFLSACNKKKEKTVVKPPAVRVRTALPKAMVFQEKINLQGNVEPQEYATLCARIDGTIDLMSVDEGDLVKKGQVLFQSDKFKLDSLKSVAEQKLNVARTGVLEAQGHLKIAEAQLEKAKWDYDRFKKLKDKNVASRDEFERKQLTWKMATLQVDLMRAGVQTANALVIQANKSFEIAQKAYEDSLIKANFDGVVTDRFKEPGEYANRGDCIIRIENPQKLEISLLISASHYNRIIPGKTKAMISSKSGKQLGEHTISYRAPRVDPKSRIFEIKIKLDNNPEIVSGMLCNVDLILATSKGYGVPRDAIIDRGNGDKVVFTVDQGKAKSFLVKPGIKDQGYVELLDLKGNALFPVVVSGQAFINDGSEVVVETAQDEQQANTEKLAENKGK